MELNLTIGEIVEARYEQQSYKSKIQDVINDEEFIIDCPIDTNGSLILLRENEKISIDVLRKEDDQKVFYLRFKVLILERIKDNNQPLIKVKKISDVEKIQRRAFFRINYDTEVLLYEKKGSILSSFDVEKAVNARLIDISANGLKILSDKNVEINKTAMLDFEIEGLHIRTEALNVFSEFKKDIDKYDVRMKFIDLGSDLEKQLVRILSKIEAEQIKNSNNKIYEESREKQRLKENGMEEVISKNKDLEIIQPLKLLSYILIITGFIFYFLSIPQDKAYMFDAIFNVERKPQSVNYNMLRASMIISIIEVAVSILSINICKKYLKINKNFISFFIIMFMLSISLFIISITSIV